MFSYIRACVSIGNRMFSVNQTRQNQATQVAHGKEQQTKSIYFVTTDFKL